MDKAKKPFHKDNRKPFHKNRNSRTEFFKKRKLEPGVEFVDKILGVGIVRKVTEEGITVAFGDLEKVIPRKKQDSHHKREAEASGKRKPFEKRVFTFDVQPEDVSVKTDQSIKAGRREASLGLEVVDEILGKGIVSRITERGVYVTYEKTGENVMYPLGLPSKLLKSAFPDKKKVRKETIPKGKSRLYKVPEQVKPEEKAKVIPHKAKETHRGNTHYIDLGIGTMVISPLYGEGVITEIADGHMKVAFKNISKDYTYPLAFADGEIEVVEKE